jgi:hypothetical protein
MMRCSGRVVRLMGQGGARRGEDAAWNRRNDFRPVAMAGRWQKPHGGARGPASSDAGSRRPTGQRHLGQRAR